MINLKNRSIAGSAALIATALTIAAASPARAEPAAVPVSYADLDISTPSGLATLRARIGRAADRICGVSRVTERLRVANCRNDVIATTEARLTEREGQAVQLAAR